MNQWSLIVCLHPSRACFYMYGRSLRFSGERIRIQYMILTFSKLLTPNYKHDHLRKVQYQAQIYALEGSRKLDKQGQLSNE
jgi:hypothetical protein